MAVFTPLERLDAERVARAHGLGPIREVIPIPAGSVNSNFFLQLENRRVFARIYEEQEAEGVAFEWALLAHLEEAQIPVPRRVRGPAPGEVRVADKPVALFELVAGVASCQAGVSDARAAAVGRMLAQCHLAVADFGWRRATRFRRPDLKARLESIEAEDVQSAVARMLRVLDELDADWPSDLPAAVMHGDLFRDNVHFANEQSAEIVAMIDWESAGLDALVYDLAVTLLAWCYGDALDWDLARSMCQGYVALRPLKTEEWAALRLAMMAAAARFTTTRITDYHLRSGVGERVHKDYRRFLARLDEVASLSSDALGKRLR